MNELQSSNESRDLVFRKKLERQQRAQQLKGISTAIGGTILMLYLGSVYVTGVIAPYIASYYNVTEKTVSYLMPCVMILNIATVPAGSTLVQRNWNPKLLVLVGGIVAMILLFIATLCNSYAGFWLFYVLSFAISGGSSYLVPIHHAWLFFPERPGLISGIIIAGFGAGPLIFDNLATAYINPHNKKTENGQYPAEVNDRFIHMMWILISCWFCLMIIGAATIFPGPVQEDQTDIRSSHHTVNTNDSEQLFKSELESGPAIEEHGLLGERASIVRKDTRRGNLGKSQLQQQLCSRQFLLIYFMSSLSLSSGVFAITNFKAFALALDKNSNDHTLALIGSLGSMCNSIRFLWSWATDYYSYKLVYGILLTVQILFNCTLKFIATNEILFGFWISVLLFCEGGHFTLVPNVLKKLFGSNATQLYGIMFTYVSVCGLILLVTSKLVLNDYASSYETFFFINGALSGVSLLLLLCLFSDDDKPTQKKFVFL